MDDSFRMSSVEGVGDFDAERKQRFRVERTARDTMLQRRAVQILHDDESLLILFADVMNCADVGVIQSRRSLGFAAEASERLRIFGDVVRQKFQGNETSEACVLGFVHDSHAAAAQHFQNAVMRDRLADHDRRSMRLPS